MGNKKSFLLNIINNKFIHFITLYVIFVFIVLILNKNIYISEELIKHHSTYFRDDIVFVYNSLLYNDGLEIHHLDHPSLFTYFFFSSIYKLFNLFGFIDFNGLEGFLNSKNIELSLSKLFYISRLIIQITSLLVIFLFYEIVKKYSQNNLVSFFITILFIFSIGFVSASNRIESGLISFFFALLAFYFFLKFVDSHNKKGLIYFALTFLFIFSAMMQKKIIFFLFPFLLFSSIFLFKKFSIEYFHYKIFNNPKFYKFILISIYFIVFSFISYKTLINNTFFLPRDLDFIFLTLNYSMLNLTLFYFIKYFQNNNYTNLLTYNLIIGATYIFYKFFLIYFFSAPIAVWSISFTNFIGQLNMFAGSDEIKSAHEFSKILLYLKKFSNNLWFVISKYFFSYTFHSVLIWLNIFLFFINKKKMSKYEKISFYFTIFGFLIIQSILLFRYEQDTYYLNSEILLLLALTLNFKFINNLKILIIFFSVILIFLIFPISLNFKAIAKNNLNSYCKNINYGFYKYYTNKIPKKDIKKFCLNYKVSK